MRGHPPAGWEMYSRKEWQHAGFFWWGVGGGCRQIAKKIKNSNQIIS